MPLMVGLATQSKPGLAPPAAAAGLATTAELATIAKLVPATELATTAELMTIRVLAEEVITLLLVMRRPLQS